VRNIYYDRTGRPVSQDEGLALFDSDRAVAKTQVGDYLVSTVHLVIDHNYMDGPPLIFETMVFKGASALDKYVARYSTEQQASEGHANVVGMVRALVGLA
jgi:hypothetical protein